MADETATKSPQRVGLENLDLFLRKKHILYERVVPFSDQMLLKWSIINRPLFYYPFHIYFAVTFAKFAILFFIFYGCFVFVATNFWNSQIFSGMNAPVNVFAFCFGTTLIKHRALIKMRLPTWRELQRPRDI